ncbi:hypothetical protein ACFX16_033478 [Malus domestica]
MKQGPVMGLDIKKADKSDRASMLLLCARSRCLIIPNLQTLFSYYPGDSNVSGLGKLLADRTICFVGIGMNKKKYLEPSLGDMMYNAGVEVGHLAARVLQKRDLETHKLHELAAEVGIDGIKPQGKVLSLLSPADAKDSSDEEYKAGKLRAVRWAVKVVLKLHEKVWSFVLRIPGFFQSKKSSAQFMMFMLHILLAKSSWAGLAEMNEVTSDHMAD